MKNIVIYLMVGVICSGFTALAQDGASTNNAADTDRLKPKAGDFGIGISAIPYLNFLGNFDTDLNLGDQTLYGKYFLTDATAIRAVLSMNNYTQISNLYAQDDAAIALDPTSTAQVIDTRKIKSYNMGLTLGYEIRKDRNRFTFLYGPYAGYQYSTSNTAYTHGNPISALNVNPSSNWAGSASGRTLSSDNGITHTLSGGLFAGIEFFIAKQFSVGADFTLAYSYAWSSQADAKYEAWDGTQVYEFDRPTSPGNKSRALSTNQYSSPTAAGAIYIQFYF
ncbi:hypothetical protein SAMN04488029_3681 [Reichenbachiella faecimaris]|uniref:Outer membrane protein beta-barrel domain-containing protein n=1 Tax=Reichenbachiella faecimaris TaxID=692418 RepID=A0A1W2GP26_REIFA|nr:hypothetical protein [Reichenbachiella faecimaris]SMD38202.1 hypothetical protein SAMN04488029_3681 [Reichenbachiella faecimaris]